MKNIFGIPMTLLVIGLFVVGGASAIVVNYLSNSAKATTIVKSPMEISFAKMTGEPDLNGDFSIVGDYTSSLTMLDTTGLSTSKLGVKVKNNADVAIEGKWLELKVSDTANDVTCADISSLQFMDTATPTQIAKGYQELAGSVPGATINGKVSAGLCAQRTGYVVYNIDINSLAAGTTYEYPAKITFANVAASTYTFDAQMLNSVV